jgi:fructokinase
MAADRWRVGVDLGGTKIAAVALGADGREGPRRRAPTPREDYGASVEAIAGLVEDIEAELGSPRPAAVGVGMPGSISPASGRVQNANSTWLNGRKLDADLRARLRRPVRLANDANCFALSEAADGAGQGARSVFGVIIGTGCGGGLVHLGRIIDGPRGAGGEWGHNPLPWAGPEETPGPQCWCGRRGCMETWVSGTGLARDYEASAGNRLTGEEIVALAGTGDAAARAALDRHASRLARGLATVINVFDPEVVVLGGGLANLAHLYEVLPGLIAPHLFADDQSVTVKPPVHGDDSGVRGAARLWGPDE